MRWLVLFNWSYTIADTINHQRKCTVRFNQAKPSESSKSNQISEFIYVTQIVIRNSLYSDRILEASNLFPEFFSRSDLRLAAMHKIVAEFSKKRCI